MTEGQWVTLCNILGLTQLLEDPRLQTRMDQINARDWTVPIVAEAVRGRSFADLIALFEQSGIPFSPIHRPAEMYDDPHVNRPGGLYTSTLPEGDTYRAPGMPFEVDDSAVAPTGLDIAAQGADTQDVLTSLGYDAARIAAATGEAA